MSGIEHRGNPDGPDLDGNGGEVVHLRVPGPHTLTFDDYPACRNGAYNLRWTLLHELVTCTVCIEIIKSGVLTRKGEETPMPIEFATWGDGKVSCFRCGGRFPIDETRKLKGSEGPRYCEGCYDIKMQDFGGQEE